MEIPDEVKALCGALGMPLSELVRWAIRGDELRVLNKRGQVFTSKVFYPSPLPPPLSGEGETRGAGPAVAAARKRKAART